MILVVLEVFRIRRMKENLPTESVTISASQRYETAIALAIADMQRQSIYCVWGLRRCQVVSPRSAIDARPALDYRVKDTMLRRCHRSLRFTLAWNDEANASLELTLSMLII
jgi:hypothetical protein